MELLCQDVLHSITFALQCSTATATKVLVIHSQSPTAEEGEDDDFGESDTSGDVKERRFANCHPLILFQSKWFSRDLLQSSSAQQPRMREA